MLISIFIGTQPNFIGGTMKVLFTTILFVSLSTMANPSLKLPAFNINKYLPSNDEIQVAENHFNNKDYNKAFKASQSLAKRGDQYSQYKISLMYFLGLGVEKDIYKAYGWAFLSNLSNNITYKNNFSSIKNSLSPEQLKVAEQEKVAIFSDYNNVRVSQRIRNAIKKDLPKCTGSRIRGSLTACAPQNISCGATLPDGSFFEGGSECYEAAAKRDPLYIANMKTNIKTMNKFIEAELEKLGTVTVTKVK